MILILDSQVRHACEMGDLDDACRFIQERLGVTDGGVAAIVFSGVDWASSSIQERMALMRSYITTEGFMK